jgi:hypothetical protein
VENKKSLYVMKLDPSLKARFEMLKHNGVLKGRFMASVLRLAFENVVREASSGQNVEGYSETFESLREISESLKDFEKARGEPAVEPATSQMPQEEAVKPAFASETPVSDIPSSTAPLPADLKPAGEDMQKAVKEYSVPIPADSPMMRADPEPKAGTEKADTEAQLKEKKKWWRGFWQEAK